MYGVCASEVGLCVSQAGFSHHASPGTAAHHVFHWTVKCKGKRGKKVLPRFQPCLKSALSAVSTELYLRNKKDGMFSI
jgi:hypothetical protein